MITRFAFVDGRQIETTQELPLDSMIRVEGRIFKFDPWSSGGKPHVRFYTEAKIRDLLEFPGRFYWI